MLKLKSSEGIPWFSVIFDIISIICTLGYYYNNNYPISSYGELINNLI